MRTDYNPFDKDFDQISIEDLATLRTVAEGWYVEYKREVPNAGAVAKSITAFANTYGGWLFYGIDEKSKEEPFAGSYPGIARDRADGDLQKIRQAVANHAEPSPYFQVKALFGPSEALGLPEDHCVIMAFVPWGPDAPYIHKDGRIYRRVGDGSEPKPENDRYILDQLWQRSEKLLDRYARWVETEPEISEAEKNAAFVRIFIIPDFWRDHPPGKRLTLGSLRRIMSNPKGGYTVPFENIYQVAGGFICRQTSNNDPENLGLTWKVGSDMRSEIIVPLAKFKADSVAHLGPWLEGYAHASRFRQLLQAQRYSSPTIVDLNMLIQALLALSLTLMRLLDAYGWRGPLAAKLHVCGVWRSVPFLDAPYVLDQYEQHGMPLSLSDKVWLRRGRDHASFLNVAELGDGKPEDSYVMSAVSLFIPIAQALGIPLGPDHDADGMDFADNVPELLAAGNRARDVQSGRAQVAND